MRRALAVLVLFVAVAASIEVDDAIRQTRLAVHTISQRCTEQADRYTKSIETLRVQMENERRSFRDYLEMAAQIRWETRVSDCAITALISLLLCVVLPRLVSSRAWKTITGRQD
jgi:hypothetical protein